MPLRVVCPICDKPHTLAEEALGRPFQCDGCTSTFQVGPAAPNRPEAPPPTPTAAKGTTPPLPRPRPAAPPAPQVSSIRKQQAPTKAAAAPARPAAPSRKVAPPAARRGFPWKSLFVIALLFFAGGGAAGFWVARQYPKLLSRDTELVAQVSGKDLPTPATGVNPLPGGPNPFTSLIPRPSTPAENDSEAENKSAIATKSPATPSDVPNPVVPLPSPKSPVVKAKPTDPAPIKTDLPRTTPVAVEPPRKGPVIKPAPPDVTPMKPDPVVKKDPPKPDPMKTDPVGAAPVYRPAMIDEHALRAPPNAEESVETLAKYLVLAARSDREKVRSIYRWVTDRIRYDVDSFLSGKIRPEDTATRAVLANRRAVCEGYANLVCDLGKAAGIKIIKVSGRAKGVGYVPGVKGARFSHAWNAVRIDDQWHLLDATWGAGDVNGKAFVKRFREFYFLAPPDQLIFTHHPRDVKWQLLPDPVSEDDFEQQPRVGHQPFEIGVTAAQLHKRFMDPTFQVLVVVYEHPGRPFQVLEVPLRRHLKAGSNQYFRVEVPDCDSLAIFHAGKFQFLTRRGKVFEGTVVVPRGPFSLCGRWPRKQKEFVGMLGYEGK